MTECNKEECGVTNPHWHYKAIAISGLPFKVPGNEPYFWSPPGMVLDVIKFRTDVGNELTKVTFTVEGVFPSHCLPEKDY